jgi:hypothetical protein
LDGSSTRGSKSTTLWHRTPWPQGCSSINSLPTCLRTTKKLIHTRSASRRCWAQQPWSTWYSTMMMKHGVMSLTTDRVRTGTRLTVSLHWRNAAEGETRMTETYAMLSMAKMHAGGSKIGVRSTSALNRSNVKRGAMIIMIPITSNLTDSTLPRESAMQEESRAFSTI